MIPAAWFGCQVAQLLSFLPIAAASCGCISGEPLGRKSCTQEAPGCSGGDQIQSGRVWIALLALALVPREVQPAGRLGRQGEK